MGLRHALIDVTPLRSSPPFRRLWLGRALSGLGSQMTLEAVMFQVWQSTRSTVWSGAVGLAQAIPLLALGIAAGSVVDRRDRRRLCLAAVAGQTGCSALLAAQGLSGGLPPAAVLSLLAAQACFAAVAAPASQTFIPRLLPGGQVAAGLALNRISSQAALLAGPAAGGVLLGWLGPPACYLVDALSFAAAFHAAFRLPPMPPSGEGARPGLSGVREGVAFLSRHAAVRGALITDLAATVLSMPVSLFPAINAERFGGDPRTLGLFLAAIGAGGAVASVFAGSFTRLPSLGLVMLAGSALWGLTLALFGCARDPWSGLGWLAVAGAADTVSVVSRGAIIQARTPDALLGRVTAAEHVIGRGGPDLGNVRGGLVAGATSASVALASGGLACLAVVALVAAGTPELRRYRATGPGGASAAEPG